MAGPGVLVTTLLNGLIIYMLFLVIDDKFYVLTSLIFGALLSPTDPVAVISLLKVYNYLKIKWKKKRRKFSKKIT